jgi:hypothetical protein
LDARFVASAERLVRSDGAVETGEERMGNLADARKVAERIDSLGAATSKGDVVATSGLTPARERAGAAIATPRAFAVRADDPIAFHRAPRGSPVVAH